MTSHRSTATACRQPVSNSRVAAVTKFRADVAPPASAGVARRQFTWVNFYPAPRNGASYEKIPPSDPRSQ